MISFDEPVNNEEGDSDTKVGDFIIDESEYNSPEKQLYHKELHNELMNIINSLTNERNREVIIKRYGLDGTYGTTLEETGKQFNLTRERVRQIEKKLYNDKNRELLKDFLED